MKQKPSERITEIVLKTRYIEEKENPGLFDEITTRLIWKLQTQISGIIQYLDEVADTKEKK